MLNCETDSLLVLILSGAVVCVYSSKQWLFPIQPEVMRQSEAPAGCNEAPCSSTLHHQVSLCLSAQQVCVCTTPRLATKPHVHKHTYTHVQSPLTSLLSVYCISLSFSRLCLIWSLGIFFLFLFSVPLLYTPYRSYPLFSAPPPAPLSSLSRSPM